MSCDEVDRLAAAYALGAVDADEERRIGEHLSTCELPHVEARDLIGVASILPASLEPIAPSPAVRARLMESVAVTPQEPARAREPLPAPVGIASRRERRVETWRRFALPVAAAIAAVAVGLGAWGLSLQNRLTAQDEVLRMVAAASAAYEVSGEAGSGWLLDSGSEATFLSADMDALPADALYALWLIGPDGTPLAVGTAPDPGDLLVVQLDRSLDDATAFAVTVESEPVDAPTSDPVMVASVGEGG